MAAVRHWAVLITLSAAIGFALAEAGIPAALLLGPMAAGILASVLGARPTVPHVAYYGAQALVGCLIASSFKPSTLAMIGHKWPLFIAVVFVTYAASLLLGYAMGRMQVLPGSTAVWGSSPGAASAMMLMSEAFGVDPRLVAYMQYLRVVFVAVTASFVARFWVDAAPATPSAEIGFHLLTDNPAAFVATLTIAAVGATVGRRLRLPAGPLLVPMVIGGVLRAADVLTLAEPQWLLAASYAVVGWKIGLGFTRDVLARAARATLPIVANVVILILVGAALAYGLVKGFGIDPLTAYLATSPGGMDSVAIIGATTRADLPFVMALHALRFGVVLAVGPAMARIVARWTEAAVAAKANVADQTARVAPGPESGRR